METSELRRRRLASGLSLREVARLIHMDPSQLSKIEHGKAQPTVLRLHAIAQAIDDTSTVEALKPLLITDPGRA